MRYRTLVSWFLFCLLAASLTLGQDQPNALTQAEEWLMDRQYEPAIALLRPEAERADGRPDYALLLLGNAYFNQRQYNDALAAYRRLVEQFPESPWKAKALFKQADCHRQLRQYEQASQLLESPLLHLVSPQRREEVAAAYLQYADRYFEGHKVDGQEEKKPDYARAKSLYEKALDLGLTPETTERVRFRIARCDYEQGEYGSAAAAFQQFLQDFPQSARVEEVNYLLGVSHLRAGHDRQARRVFRDFLTDHPQSGFAGDVRFALGETYHVPQPRDAKELELGVKALREFVAAFPDHEKAVQADFFIGLSYFNQNRFEDAVREFQRFIAARGHQDRPELPQAMNLLGTCFLRQKQFRAAIEAWEQFLRTYVTHSSWNEIQRQVIDTEYLIGADAYADKRYDEAREVWAVFQERHPLDVRNPDIMFLLGMMHFEQGQWDPAIVQWEKLTSKYPDTEAAARGWFMIGQTYEQKLDQLAAAMKAYEKVQQGEWQNLAQQRLAALKQKQLVVYTERTYTTADPPVLKVLTRNLKHVDFRGYQVDLEDYFRKRHTIQGVEGLDLALIEPDQRWALDVEGFREFKEFETEVALPFKEPGIYAVTCSAPPDQATPERTSQLEATAIVMITDLAIVAKTTRRDVLVFAENVKTQQAFPGAQVLVSDGQKIIATGQTGEDGVWHAEVAGLKDVGEVRVLAFADGHFASTQNPLGDVQYAVGLTPRGYLYTDRPVYRPGQSIRVRGIVRKVDRGRYVFQPGEEFQVQVLDPTGAVVRTRTVALSEFGTFSDEFTLPPEAALGRYNLVARQENLTFQGSFDVLEYKLERVRLTFDVPKRSVLRGEDITGTVRADYYYGEPLVGRKIRFGWNDEPGRDYETDAEGKIKFTVPTRQFEEEQGVRLWARLDEEGIIVSEMVYVAVVGLQARLRTLRGVYLVNERFDATVQATDLADKPAAAAFTLHVLKQEVNEKTGQVGERQVAEQAVQTDAEKGEATASLTLAEAGRYVLRLLGADANGNPVTVEHYVQAVGEEDKVKLRLLTDRDQFNVGETAQVHLVSWLAAKLTLLTYEGERIYGYQIAGINSGENTIHIPLTAELAPSFVLAACAMDGNEFHTATKALQVKQALRVEVTPEKPTYRPGDTVRLALQTKDQNGKAVPAELSLAAVDAALFAVHGDLAPDLERFFYQRDLAEKTVATQTSCTFHYSAEAKQQVLQVRALETAMPGRAAGRVPMLDIPIIGDLFFQGEGRGRGETVAGYGGFGGAGMGGGGAFADVPFDHWAYQELADLADAGLLEGYPAGAFKGQQPMTRYEFAKGVARLLDRAQEMEDASAGEQYALAQNWGRLQRLAEEFRPELEAMGERVEELEEAVEQVAVNLEAALPESPSPTPAGRPPAQRDGAPGPQGPAWPQGPLGPGRPVTLLREFFPETAFWNAHVVTDENGQAQVEFQLPDTITEWRLTARGVTVETLAGTQQAKVVTSQPFLAELKLPPLFQQGDTVFLTADLHNNTDNALQTTVKLATQVGEATAEQQENLDVPAHGQRELAFRVEVPAGREMVVKLEATSPEGVGDAVERTVPIRPWGMEYVATAGGTTAADRTVWLELPAQPYTQKELTLTLGPSLDRALLDAAGVDMGYPRITRTPAPSIPVGPLRRLADGRGSFCPPIVSSIPDRAQTLLAAVSYLRQIGRGETPEYRQLAADLDAQLARLAATQNEDGGWGWAAAAKDRRQGPGGSASDPEVSAQAVSALAGAWRLGLLPPGPGEALEKGLAYLQNQFQQAGEQDHERKAAILHAQALAGRADFAHANRLHRLRQSLDTRSLALLMIALADMGRAEMGRELEPVLTERIKREERGAEGEEGKQSVAYCEAIDTPSRWGGDPVEVTALALLALIKVQPTGPPANQALLNGLAEWLWSQRYGTAWATPRATAAAVTALAYHAGLSRPAAEKYTVAVRVNDVLLDQWEVTGETPTVTLDVPPEALADRRAKVTFDLEGRGQLTYTCLLRGFTEDVREVQERFRVQREYVQALRQFEGKPVPCGFGVVEGGERWTNWASEIVAGTSLQVRLNWFSTQNFRPGRYVVLREPLPTGAKVLEETIRGSFERYELGPAEITFFFRNPQDGYGSGSVSYDLYGSLTGAYRALPPRVWSYYQPGNFATGPVSRLNVLRRDQPSKDEYRLTPDERYFLGRAYFDRHQYALAEPHLTELFNHWKLKDEPFKEVARMLFYVALDRFTAEGGDPAAEAQQVVRFFEILRERYPDLVVPLEKIVQVAQAYGAIHEWERATQVYLATAEASFNKESRVAGVLSDEGEFEASVDFMRRLALTYPDLPATENALYTLGQFIYGQASQPSTPSTLQQAGLDALTGTLRTPTLIDRAMAQIREFLVLYPESPIADEASFSFANALLDLERYDEAIAWCQRLPGRYRDTVFLDDFEYIQAYAHFLNEQFDPALTLCQRLATEKYLSRAGQAAPSDYRALALYIAAQVHHSRGEPAEAVKFYRQVAEQFSDASEALNYFERKRLDLPEVTFARGEEPAKLKLSYRNVASVNLKVYQVDLLKFYQIHRSLKDIAQMNLAGIRPTFEDTVTLEGGQDYTDREFELQLALPEKGAYFVMAKGEGVAASGVILRTDLDLEVQEEPASGRVRVNVVNQATKQSVPKAEVWVIGSREATFRQGQSDLRGVLIAEGIQGTATVVAWKEGQYAFHRGQVALQPEVDKEKAPEAERKRADFKDEARRDLREQNVGIQQQRGAELKGQVSGERFQGGVQVQEAY